jgi:hypothetical protein
MQTKYKRHQKVVLLVAPDAEYIEYEPDFENQDIKKGALGEINILLPNGQYHVKIIDGKGNTIAYAPMSEEDLGPAEE